MAAPGKKVIIHLNAGVSKRVIDFVENNYPRTHVNWIAFGDYSSLTLENMKDEDIEAFRLKLELIYPVEYETILPDGTSHCDSGSKFVGVTQLVNKK